MIGVMALMGIMLLRGMTLISWHNSIIALPHNAVPPKIHMCDDVRKSSLAM